MQKLIPTNELVLKVNQTIELDCIVCRPKPQLQPELRKIRNDVISYMVIVAFFMLNRRI